MTRPFNYFVFPSLLLSVLLLSQVPQVVKAQGVYFRIGGGYAWEAGKTEFNDADPNEITNIQQSTDVTLNADGTITVEALNGTLGEGYKATATVGYMFAPYIGVEVTGTYFHGQETLIGRFQSPSTRSESIAYLRGFDVMPAIILTPGFEGINPYTRFGLILSAGGDLTVETAVDQVEGVSPDADLRIRAETEVQPRFSIGYSAVVGVAYPITETLRVFGELQYNNYSLEGKDAEITRFTTLAVTDGETNPVPGRQLKDLPVSQKQFVFEDEFTLPATQEPPADEPRTLPTRYLNASNVGINIGLRIGLNPRGNTNMTPGY